MKIDMSLRYHHNCYEIDDTLVDGWADEESIPMGIGGLVGLCVLLAICGKINEQSSSSSSSSSMSAERLSTPPQRSMPRHVPMQQQMSVAAPVAYTPPQIQAQHVASRMFCGSCGAKGPFSSTFCTNCGAQV